MDWKIIFLAGFFFAVVLIALGVRVFHFGGLFDVVLSTDQPSIKPTQPDSGQPVATNALPALPIPTKENSVPEQPTPIATVLYQTELIGEWVYQQPRASMPAPAGTGQVIFAHGDIDNSGTCHVKEFGPGETVQGLGLGGFKLWQITGDSEYIGESERQLQNGAAIHAGTRCPYLP